MRIVASSNQKGGCGKTLILVTAAAELARRGNRALVVDSDPHAAASFHLRKGLDEEPFLSLFDVLMGRCKLKDAIEQTAFTGLSIVRGEDDLKNLREMKTISPHLFSEAAEDHHFLLLDTPPAASPYRDLLMMQADDILVPMFAEPDSIEGLVRQLREWQKWSAAKEQIGKGPINLLGVVVTNYNERYATHKGVMKEIRQELDAKGIPLLSVIPASGSASNAPNMGVPIPFQKRLKASPIHLAFAKLARAIEKAGTAPKKKPILVTNDIESLSGEIEL